MKSAEIIYQLRDLKETWRKQDFTYTKEQQALYDRLIELRRERVRYFFDNNLVSKGKSSAE